MFKAIRNRTSRCGNRNLDPPKLMTRHAQRLQRIHPCPDHPDGRPVDFRNPGLCGKLNPDLNRLLGPYFVKPKRTDQDNYCAGRTLRDLYQIMMLTGRRIRMLVDPPPQPDQRALFHHARDTLVGNPRLQQLCRRQHLMNRGKRM